MNADTRTCHYCGKALNIHKNIDDPELKPKEGDFSLCLYCGELGIFTAEGIVRPLIDHSELDNLNLIQLQHAMQLRKMFHETKKDKDSEQL